VVVVVLVTVAVLLSHGPRRETAIEVGTKLLKFHQVEMRSRGDR
jgi:hypothetical protein